MNLHAPPSPKAARLAQWYQRVWIDQDLDAIEEFVCPNLEASGIVPEVQMAPSDFRELVGMICEMATPISITIPITLEQDDWMSAFVQVEMRCNETGKVINVTGQTIVLFQGDKFREAYNSFDFMTLFERLGQLPDSALSICLTGQKLVWA